MDRVQLYRLLVAEHLDLLEPHEQEQLAQALQESGDINRTEFSKRLRTALGERADLEREQRFFDAISAAEREQLESPPEASARELRASPRRRSNGVWRLSLAAAAGAAAVWLGGELWRQTPAPESPAALPASPPGEQGGSAATQAVFLNAMRSDDAGIDLDASSATSVTLIAEARLKVGSVMWDLTDADGERVGSGRLEFAAPDSALRTIAIRIEKSRLDKTHYSLTLQDDRGTELRRWAVSIQ